MMTGWILTKIDLTAQVPLHKAKPFSTGACLCNDTEIESTGIYKTAFLPKESV